MTSATNKPLRMGIVGCGDIAGYVALFARINLGLQITACCDRNLETAQAFARKHNIVNPYVDFNVMLAQAELDAVYIAVPHYLHYDMIMSSVEAGWHVLVEKPITRTLQEGVEIAQLAKQTPLKIGVNYQYRYDRGCYALAAAARSGALGELYYARINLPWQRENDYFETGQWRGTIAQAGGGTLMTQGSHMLDIALWALNSYPISAAGYTTQRRFQTVEVEDLAVGNVEMANGAMLQISSSMVAKPEQALQIQLYGERGTAIYADKPWPHTVFRGARVRRQRPPVPGWHALMRSLEGFRRWVVDAEPYLIPAPEAVPALAVVDAIYRSTQSGQRESIQTVL